MNGQVRNRGLDGLRGLALVGMLAWHAELDVVRGGFARMTVFFVLSGFLATRSWDRRRSPGADEPEGFLRFWSRRTLRLLPMTLVGVATAIAVTVAVGTPETRRSLGGDALAVLTYTSNFHFIDTEQSYGELFERHSAFQHFWSLSIEEQLFLALPVVLVVVGWLGRRSGLPARLRTESWTVLALLAVAVAVGSVVAQPAPDTLYFGTPTRFVEFVAGAALARARLRPVGNGLTGRRVGGAHLDDAVRTASRSGRVAFAVLIGLMVLVDRDASWVHAGGMHLVVIPVVALVAALDRGDVALQRILGIRPVVWMGRAALSIYVLHWPVYVALGARLPTAWNPAAVAAIQIAVGVAVGGAAHRFVEAPLLEATRRMLAGRPPVVPESSAVPQSSRARASRARVRLGPRSTLASLAGVGVVLAVIAAAATAERSPLRFEEAAAAHEARAGSAGFVGSPQPGSPPSGASASGSPAAEHGDAASPGTASSTDTTIAVFGGSTAMMHGLGLMDWASRTSAADVVAGHAQLGCGLVVDGERSQGVDGRGRVVFGPVPDRCEPWRNEWASAVAARSIDVAVVFVGVWEIADWRIDDETVSIDDAEFSQRLAELVDDAVVVLAEAGVDRVVLMALPQIGTVTDDGPPDRAGQDVMARERGLPSHHRDRVDAFNALLTAVARDRGATSVTTFDYPELLQRYGAAGLLPDGVHPTWDSAIAFWSGPAGDALLAHIDDG